MTLAAQPPPLCPALPRAAMWNLPLTTVSRPVLLLPCAAGPAATLTALVTVTGKRWSAEECHQQGKGQTGLDQHQVRLWCSFCRHTMLSMCAQALLAVAAARPAPAPPPDGTLADRPPADPGHGRDQRPRGPPPGPPRRRAHDPRHPRGRLCLVTMKTPSPGTRPLAPLPRPPQRSCPPPVTRRRQKGGRHVTNRDCSTGFSWGALLPSVALRPPNRTAADATTRRRRNRLCRRRSWRRGSRPCRRKIGRARSLTVCPRVAQFRRIHRLDREHQSQAGAAVPQRMP